MRKAAKSTTETDDGAAPAAAPPAGFDFTRGNQKFNDASRFFSFLDAYPDTGGVSIYVYRTANPTIERDRNGIQVNYIGCHAQKIDADFMLGEYGSGKFWIVFNDLMRPHSAKTVAELSYEINDLRNPARFVPEELVVEDASNRRWLDQLLSAGYVIHETDIERMAPDPANPARKKKSKVKVQCLRRPESLAAAAPAPAAAATPVAAAPVASAESGLLSQLMGAMLGRMADPFETALKINQQLHPAAQPALDPMVKALLEKVLLREVSPAAATPAAAAAAPADPFERVDTALTFTDKLMKRFGGGGGSEWASTAKTFVENLPGILTGGAALIAAFRTGATPVAAAPAVVRAAADTAPAPAAPGAVTIPTDAAELEMWMISEIQRVGLAAVQAFTNGECGDDFAASLHTGPGAVEGSKGLVHSTNPNDEKVYDFLYAQGYEKIIGFLAMLPGNMVEQIPDRPAFEKFLRDFIEYGNPEEVQQ